MGKSFAVIGDPINHSLSPIIHSAAFRELNLDSSYIGYRIPKGESESGVEGLKKIKRPKKEKEAKQIVFFLAFIFLGLFFLLSSRRP